MDQQLTHRDKVKSTKHEYEWKLESESGELVKEFLKSIEANKIQKVTPENPQTKENKPRVNPVLSTVSPEIYNRLNLTKDAGQYGKGIKLENVPSDIQTMIDDGWHRHEFNELVSDLIALNRSLPDPRSRYCKFVKYFEKLPRTSVIIIFHNEAWSTLLRTVHSVMNKSPEHLIEEILLVDDCSNMGKHACGKCR